MTRTMLLTGAAVTGAVGYGLALGLARAATYAERVEEDEYCRPRARGRTTPTDAPRTDPAQGSVSSDRLPDLPLPVLSCR